MNKLTAEQIKSVEALLSRGDRVELIPGPDGSVKVVRIKREIILRK